MDSTDTDFEPNEDNQCGRITGDGLRQCTLHFQHSSSSRCLQHDPNTGEALYGWRGGALTAFEMKACSPVAA